MWKASLLLNWSNHFYDEYWSCRSWMLRHTFYSHFSCKSCRFFFCLFFSFTQSFIHAFKSAYLSIANRHTIFHIANIIVINGNVQMIIYNIWQIQIKNIYNISLVKVWIFVEMSVIQRCTASKCQIMKIFFVVMNIYLQIQNTWNWEQH